MQLALASPSRAAAGAWTRFHLPRLNQLLQSASGGGVHASQSAATFALRERSSSRG